MTMIPTELTLLIDETGEDYRGSAQCLHHAGALTEGADLARVEQIVEGAFAAWRASFVPGTDGGPQPDFDAAEALAAAGLLSAKGLRMLEQETL